MSGAEVEDASLSSCEATSAAEDFAALKTADEYQFIRLRNIEELAVHLLIRDVENRRHPLRDGVSGIDCPDGLAVVVSPSQGASRSHELCEDFRPVS